MIPYITGSDFSGTYNLSQFHFHWGFNFFQGSEHLIDSQKFPLEVKITNLKLYLKFNF